MPSAAAETTREPREGKNVLPIIAFLLLALIVHRIRHGRDAYE
jgi:hypothetical protein